MLTYKKYMKDFMGDMLEIIVEPELDYDEKEMDVLRQKHIGRSVMVSAFVLKKLRGEPKGIQQVLEECNLWPVGGVNLVCDHCFGKIKDNFEKFNCCAQKIISIQLDFCEQQSLLKEPIVRKGHIFELYPNS
ncbi:14045_t:CDS:2 [Gigaspora rosea]|nr:14045_t:CDS:2 [Gigaspora rosea]